MRPEVRSADSGRRRSASGKIAAIMLEVSGEPGLTLTDVARRTGLPVSTTHRLLSELVEGRLLVRNSDGAYTVCRALRGHVGSREHAAQARSQVNLVLEDLAVTARSRARFGVWQGNELGVSYLECAVTGGRGRCSAGLTILPAHATALGKALLAHAPPPVVQDVVDRGLPSYTPHTLTSAWQLHAALAATRRKGMATSRWELRDGECAVAVAVSGLEGRVVGALELAVDDLANALHDARLLLVVAARGLSRQLALTPGAMPTGSGREPLSWRADPTSAALTWSEPEAAV
jgi:DNA-binding IclR family transcriptional regulator